MALSGSPFDTPSRKDAGLESLGRGLREQFVSSRRPCLLSGRHSCHSSHRLPSPQLPSPATCGQTDSAARIGWQERDGVVIIRQAVTQEQVAQLRDASAPLYALSLRHLHSLLTSQPRSLRSLGPDHREGEPRRLSAVHRVARLHLEAAHRRGNGVHVVRRQPP